MTGYDLSTSVFRPDLLTGRVALVTGGATGIGYGICETPGAHGAAIAMCARTEERLESACTRLEADGITASYGVCDVREPDQVERVVDEAIATHGRIDILINNAAGNFPAKIEGLSYNGFKAVVSIDLLGTYNVTKAVHSKWMADHGGNIVNISAPYDRRGISLQAHVGAAKMGVDSLTRTSAVEFGEQGIRVNGIAPGGIANTEGMERIVGDSSAERTANNPMGEPLDPYDIADAALFLVSDGARHISGEIITVDAASSIDMMKLNRR